MQGRSRAVAGEWLAEAERTIGAAFAQIDPDDAEAAALAAERLLTDEAWIAPLLAPLIAALADDPWFEPPLRVSRDAVRTGAILYENAGVTVAATVVAADALATAPAPAAIVAPGRLAITRYHRASGARLLHWHVGLADADFAAAAASHAASRPAIDLADGMVVRLDGRSEAHVLDGAGDDVVTLTATIRAGASPFVREYHRDTGALVRCAALDETPSRTAMLLTMLRLSGRADTAAIFEAATRDTAFFLRWHAMREWLALDTAAAFPRLTEMAVCDPNPEIRAIALQTLETIERKRPCQCPA